jgi:hypothetical protein
LFIYHNEIASDILSGLEIYPDWRGCLFKMVYFIQIIILLVRFLSDSISHTDTIMVICTQINSRVTVITVGDYRPSYFFILNNRYNNSNQINMINKLQRKHPTCGKAT